MTAKNYAFTELHKLTGGNTLGECAKLLRMVPDSALDIKFTGTATWVRGGAETYILPFGLTYEDGSTTRSAKYIFKACVAQLSAKSIEEIVLDWLARRELLVRTGVKAPHLFGYGQGIILEEFIPHQFRGRAITSETSAKLRDLVTIVFAVRGLGFTPINIAGDIRTRGSDAVIVDFGSDLGASHQVPGRAPTLDECISFAGQAFGCEIDSRKVEKFFREHIALRAPTE